MDKFETYIEICRAMFSLNVLRSIDNLTDEDRAAISDMIARLSKIKDRIKKDAEGEE